MQTQPCPDTPVSGASRERVTGLILTLFLLTIFASVLRTGYRDIKGGNHPLQLITVQKILEPELYPNDAFVEQTAFAYASPFWYAVAYASSIVDLRLLLFILFVANRVLYAYAFYLIARVFFPSSPFAPVGALTFFAFAPTSLLGEGEPFRDSAEQTGLAIAVILLTLVAFTQHQYLRAALLLGVAMNLNLMYAIFAIVYLGACLLMIGVYRRSWKQVSATLLLSSVIGLPALRLVLHSSSHPIGDETAVWQTMELLFPFHFYPNASPPNKHLIFLALLLLTIIVCIRMCRRTANRPTWQSLRVWSVVALGFYLLGWAAPYLFRSLPLTMLQPLRGNDIWFLVAGAVLSGGVSIALHRRVIQTQQKFVTAGLLAVGLIHGAAEQAERVRRTGYWHGIPYTASNKIAAWAKRNTSREVVFLIPVSPTDDWMHFRHLSQSNIFTHWKDGSACSYAPWYCEEWLNRLYLLGLAEVAGIDPKTYRIGSWVHKGRNFIQLFRRVDEQVSQALVERITQKGYRVDYWVLPEHKPTTFPVVYRVDGWKVVRVIPKEGSFSGLPRR